MGFLDDIKKVFSSSDDEYDEEFAEQEEEQVEEVREKREKEPRLFRGDRNKVVSYNQQNQMQVVLCKPERYEDVPANIAQKIIEQAKKDEDEDE